MLRRTFAPLVAAPAPLETEVERVRRENKRILTLVAAVVVATLFVVVALGAVARAGSAPAGNARELALERNGDIYLVGADGTRARNLTRTKAKEHAPAWSSDGRRIAFVSYRDGNGELYVADADRPHARRITRNRAEDLSPAWSPDGARIAFVSNRSGEFEIYVMNADGTGLRRLTRDAVPGYGSYSPAWSPDGRRIVFHSSARTPENTEVYSMLPDGSGLRRLTRTTGDVETLGDDSFPQWSPDGRRIVFTSNRKDGGAIWVMRPDGRGQRMLLNFRDSDDWTPEYSPDGRTIAFARLFPGGRAEIWLVGADGRGARRVGPGFEPAWRPLPRP